MSLQKNPGPARRFARLMKLANWLLSLPNKLTPPPFRLMQIGSAFWQSGVLFVAVRLDVASVLGDGQLSADDIASRISAQPDATYGLLRMLSAMGVFDEVAPRMFRNSALSSYLREDNPKNVRAMVLMHSSAEMSQPWYEQLEQGVRSGNVPFRLAHGMEMYSYMNSHPEFDALFTRAMDSVAALTGNGFATDFAWERFERIIDVGGSRGGKSLAILKLHPHLKALVVDRAEVIEGAAQYWTGREAPALLSRMSFEAADLLEAVPAATGDKDIYLLSAVMHGFDDDTCVKALDKLATASAGTGARIALMEMVLPESRPDLAGASFDMQMFMGTCGRDRALAEWQGLFDRCGLLLEEVISLRSIGNILVLSPK